MKSCHSDIYEKQILKAKNNPDIIRQILQCKCDHLNNENFIETV